MMNYIQEQFNNQLNDQFVAQVENATKIQLTPQKIRNDIIIYKVPTFPQINRNHYNNRLGGDKTPIKFLIYHYTVINFYKTLEMFTRDTDIDAVSSTYIITQNEPNFQIPSGKIIQVTPEEKKSWHAGISKWQQFVNLNDTSIGIELVNDGVDQFEKFVPFDEKQIKALAQLSKIIIEKFNISPVCILGHSDIAPDRKIDPGILFPWGKLYTEYGIGAWLTKDELSIERIKTFNPTEPLPQEVNLQFLSRNLGKFGYNIQETKVLTNQFSSVLKAFKAHFSYNQIPEKYNDQPDMIDMIWIWGLTAKYKNYLTNY